jgi:hypothetical protein
MVSNIYDIIDQFISVLIEFSLQQKRQFVAIVISVIAN